MSESFRDHFSSCASAYAEHRPGYTAELATYLASLTPGRELAWDCGTGSGQAAVVLAAEFERVIATDASAEQLAHARPHPRVEYRRALDRDSGLPTASCDLVTAGQAAHWFDLPAFYQEVDRVLRPGGAVAIWCYNRTLVSPAIDPVISRFQYQRVGPYWPSGREHTDAEYRTLPFPYDRLEAPPIAMRHEWTRHQLEAYMGTWSSVRRCREVEGVDPMIELARDLDPLWPDTTEVREVRWPLCIIAGRKPG
jgi:SAM-dependent methyltransferase